jgi:sec-independent protein translocase protein TatB
MFGISGYEAAVIAIVALIIIGPRDLPKILRVAGHWMGKAQRMANEFRRALDQMAKETGVDEVKRQVEKAASLHPANQVRKAVLGSGASSPAASSTASVPATPKAETPKANGAAEPSAPTPAGESGPSQATGTS